MKRFEVYCPAGWIRIDLTEDLSSQARFVTESLVPAGGGDRRGPVVRITAGRLESALRELSEGGAWSVMMPIAGDTALGMRPTIVFAPFIVPPSTEPMDALVALASSDPTATIVDIEPLVALRTHASDDITAPFVAGTLDLAAELPADDVVSPVADPDGDRRALSRRVRFVLGDPTDNDRWTDVLFSLTHLDDPEQADVADAAVAAFDALVATFRWLP